MRRTEAGTAFDKSKVNTCEIRSYPERMPEILQRIDGGCGFNDNSLPGRKQMLQKMGGVKRSRDFRVSVWNDRLFQGLGQEAAFRAVVVMPVAVVRMVMITVPVVRVMIPVSSSPKSTIATATLSWLWWGIAEWVSSIMLAISNITMENVLFIFVISK